MKAYLEFNLDNPDDTEKFRRVNAADNLCSAIYDFENWMRTERKHGIWSNAEDRIWDKFFEILDDNGVNLEEIWT